MEATRLTINLAAASATAVAAVQAVASAKNLVLTGGANLVAGPTLIQGTIYSNYAQMDVARRILLTDTLTTDTAVVFTINGFNRDLQPISEKITGLSTTLYTQNDFLIVTSVAVSAATNGSISAGTNGVGSTPWVQVTPEIPSWNLSAMMVLLSGSATAQFEWTYDDLNAALDTAPGFSGIILENAVFPPVVLPGTANAMSTPYSGNAAITATTALEIQYTAKPIVAHRLTVTTGTGTVAFYSLQSGIKS